MKSTVLGMAVLALSAAAAYGQSRYDVPFNFRVGEKTFTAGTYTVSKITDRGNSGPVWVRSETGDHLAVMPQAAVQLARAPESGTLVFHRYGNIYYLSQIWRAGSSEGLELGKSKAEREMARTGTRPEVARAYAVR